MAAASCQPPAQSCPVRRLWRAMPSAPSTHLQHPKTHPSPPKTCTTGRCCPPSCSAPAPSSSSSSAPGATLQPPRARGQGWALVGTPYCPLPFPAPQSAQVPPLAGGWRVQKDPGPCGDAGVTHLTLLQGWGWEQGPPCLGSPPALQGTSGCRTVGGAQASPAAARGETEARSRAAEVPGLGALTPGLAEQKAGARRSTEGVDTRGLSPSAVAEAASPHRCHHVRSSPARTPKLRDPRGTMDTHPLPRPQPSGRFRANRDKKLFKEWINGRGHL